MYIPTANAVATARWYNNLTDGSLKRTLLTLCAVFALPVLLWARVIAWPLVIVYLPLALDTVASIAALYVLLANENGQRR